MPAMVLNASGIGNVDTSSSSRHNAMLKQPVPLRRRRSKGAIASFASSSSSSQNDSTSHEMSHNDIPSVPTSSFGGENASYSGDGTTQPQHANDTSQTSVTPPPPPKPCNSARLALLAAQNAIHMGARTQLNLCPPGKTRDDLLKILQMKRRKKKSIPPPIRRTLSLGRSPSFSSISSRNEDSASFDKIMGESGLTEYDHAEEDYLNNPVLHSRDLNSDGEEMKEDSSSGDEDSLDFKLDDEDGIISPQGTDEGGDEQFREKLYTLSLDMTGGQSSSNSKKLAFNMRKLKWFDAVTASDRATARQYLRKEFSNLRKKDISLLTKHLKKMQRREKRRLEIEKGRRRSLQSVDSNKTSDTLSDDEDEEVLEQSMHNLRMSRLPSNMTPSLSAALVLESLSITPLESLEGMSKCYEGIVAAGSALLDAIGDDTNSERSKPSKSEIMSALAPLLITKLEKASGETILALAKLRKLCGTKRYQRRFVQRIAPSLVRPPNAAMWCLRHRDEMESIFAATEMILDSSFDVFASGWYERGRTILADSERAKTLEAAAMQLKHLSTHQYSDRTKGLSSVSHRRLNTRFLGSTPAKDVSTAGTSVKKEVLAEWEVLAVDRQIRRSIENLFTMDWSRVHLTNVPPRDGESYINQRTKSRGITGNRPKLTPSEQADTGTSVSSDQNTVLSPKRPVPLKNMPSLSPSTGLGVSVDGEFGAVSGNLTSVNSPTFIIQNDATNLHESQVSDYTSPPNTPTPKGYESHVGTPPRSPPHSQSGLLSPSRNKPSFVTPPLNKQGLYAENGGSVPNFSPGNAEGGRPGLAPAPLSPSNTSRKDTAHQRFPSIPGSQSTYLRTLTSTAAERKRTVAACRALRAQIARFEDAFIHLHGRQPKGASERAPLATTYAQYREWKRAIRADAASRIQALFRGARMRDYLLRNDPRFREIVMNRLGRPEPKPVQNIQHLSIPNNVGQTASHNKSNMKKLPRRDQKDAYYGVEVYYQENNSTENNSPSRKAPRDDEFSWSVSTGPQHHYSSRTDSMSTSSLPSFNDMSLRELQARKRELKQQLKQYDMSFFNQHGRMPVKEEKEPIRPLYENYNSLKNRISAHEREGPPITPAITAPRTAPSPITHNYTETNGNSDFSMPLATNSSSEKNGKWKGSRSPSGKITTSGNSSQDLAGLKTEKQTLHQMLRSYEKDFFNKHNRQVSCYADIRPVASQYRRYKEIKKQISSFQDSLGDKKM